MNDAEVLNHRRWVLTYAREHGDSANGPCRRRCRGCSAAVAFFVETGLEVEGNGSGSVEGQWVARVVSLRVSGRRRFRAEYGRPRPT